MKTICLGPLFDIKCNVVVDDFGTVGRVTRQMNCPTGIEYMIVSDAHTSALYLTERTLLKFNKPTTNEEIRHNTKAVFGCTEEGTGSWQ